jgi:pilus assembly protein CpaE
MSRQLLGPLVTTLPSSTRLANSGDFKQGLASSAASSEILLSAAITGSGPAGGSPLHQMLLETSQVRNIRDWVSPATLRLLHAQDVPDVVFLDMNADGAADFSFAQQLIKLRPSVHIVACSARNLTSPDFLLQAMRSGVRDFLQKPYDRSELSSLIARVVLERRPESARRTSAAKLLVVLGTKGGVGTSTVAVNLAVHLARMRDKKVSLLDFSRPMGDVAALLDLQPSFQLRDALQNEKRLDATLLAGLMTPHSSGLQVLSGASHLEDWQTASFSTVERIVEIAQQCFDFVVMDLGSHYSAEWKNVLQASEIVLVSEADLPGLAKLHRHLGALANLQIPSAQVRLIINRWHRHDDQALEKVELGMRMPVFARLPNDFKQVNDATVRGVPVTRGGDPLSSGFQSIALRLAGEDVSKQQKKSRLGQLFSR